LKYSEKIHEDGSIDTSNIDTYVKSGEFQTDKYILKGDGMETWEPRFTYHGFQYVQIAGFPGTPSLDSLCGRVVHTALEKRGSFKCSNELLNSIQECSLRSTLYNYHGVPTDCPHREKNGWTGDAALSAEQVLLNFNPVSAYEKWLKDIRDVQRGSGQLPGIVPTGGWGFNWGSGPAWDSVLILIPWYIYLYCGDQSVLEDLYENMKKYVEFMTSMAEDGICNFGLGDWCPPVGGPEAFKSPTAVTDTAYYYLDTMILAETASLLGRKEDHSSFAALAASIRKAFRKEFLDTETGLVKGNCQTSTSCALYQGMINPEEQSRVLEKLVEQIEAANRHIDCGILGAKYVMHVITDLGRADLAYAMATQTDFPGWGHWIAQGATTLWETWAGDSSLNHHMFSDISAWFYKGLAGINPDTREPGFKHILLKPNPVEGLGWVNASHESAYGMIVCNWKVEKDEFSIHVEVPVNCHATLYMPLRYSGRVIALESGKHCFVERIS
jgi:alpha-L-rhamnosidase